MMSPVLLEGACGRKKRKQGSHAFQAAGSGQAVHTSWVRAHDGERSLRGESICGLSTGRVQVTTDACQLWTSETGGAAAGFSVTSGGKTRDNYQQPVVLTVTNAMNGP